MRIHFSPAFPADDRHPELDWLTEKCQGSRGGRWSLADGPRHADAIVLCDIGLHLSQSRHVRLRRLLDLLRHPCLGRSRNRCMVYYEADVPKPYLPGLYSFMEWFPGVERVGAAIAPGRALEHEWPRPAEFPLDDDGRALLFSFVGRDSHPVRAELLRARFQRSDVVVEDTSVAYAQYMQARAHPRRDRYTDIMRRSRWAICPRGWSASSIRLFEAMRLGVAPVVLSDNWDRPHGIDWDACSLWVPERRVRDLPSILDAQGDAWRDKGAAAHETFHSQLSSSTIFEHYAGAVESLLSHCAGETLLTALERQIPEILALLAGAPGPPQVATHRLGSSAIELTGNARAARSVRPIVAIP